MRFLVLSLSLLLLVGFSSTANAAPNSGQISGFDAFRGLMDKIVSHWGATHRVSEAKWQKDRLYCNETMSTLMMEANKYKDILATANNTVANWTAKAEKAKQSLAPLEKRLSELKIELAPILNQIKHGEETRAIEGRVNSQKINDTKSLMAAVEVIVEKLKDGKTDNPRFKEELEATKSLVSDPEVQSLIEGAVSAVEKIPVYLETNLYRLQKLFWLLNNELQRYIDEVVEQEKLLDATWEENRRPLDEKREGLEKQVTAASEDLVDGKKVIEQANEQIQKAQAVLDGVTPKKLEATNAELQLVEERCKRRHAQFEREMATSKGVDDTVQALDTIVSEAQRRDDGTGEALGRLVGLQIPAPTVCCRKCVSSYACGDTCVSDKDQCDLPVGSGCACGEDDPRLAAFEQAK